MNGPEAGAGSGIATLLVSPQPFTQADVAAVETLARKMQFVIAVSPTHVGESAFSYLTSSRDFPKFMATYPLDLSPPTDDRPFFFYMVRPGHLLHRSAWHQGNLDQDVNLRAVVVLGSLLITVVALTFLCILLPLFITSRRELKRPHLPLLLFFAGIGLGFMCIEMSQMQRLMVFLGHPTYGLTVVLFALLLSSGLGSRLTQGVAEDGVKRAARLRLALLLVGLAIFAVLTPYVTAACAGASTPVRIAISVALLLPLGMLLGMPFPLGMKLAAKRAPALIPWLWGINGATSVCASVIAVVIALQFGITASFLTGAGCYALALVSVLAVG